MLDNNSPEYLKLSIPNHNRLELSFFQQLANLFNKNIDLLVQNFTDQLCFNTGMTTIKNKDDLALLHVVRKLYDIFIQHLSNMDMDSYLFACKELGNEFSSLDIPEKVLITLFHFYENSFDNLLPIKNIHHSINQYKCLDQLHHLAMGEILSTYTKISELVSHALVSLTELKDLETGEHIKRTATYTRFLANKMNMNSRDIHNIGLAAPLHDIGKVLIPSSILNKPGKLTEEEFNIMKTHAKLGSIVIKKIIVDGNIKKGYLPMAYDIAKYHHEKWDGTGYFRLKGEEIPLAARIFTLADIFDALTSKRPYKQAFTFEESVEIIQKSESMFDPNILTIFLENLNLFKMISIGIYVENEPSIAIS